MPSESSSTRNALSLYSEAVLSLPVPPPPSRGVESFPQIIWGHSSRRISVDSALDITRLGLESSPASFSERAVHSLLSSEDSDVLHESYGDAATPRGGAGSGALSISVLDRLRMAPFVSRPSFDPVFPESSGAVRISEDFFKF